MSYTHKKGYWRYANIRMDITGLESFDKYLQALPNEITQKVLVEELTQVAKDTAEVAKSNCRAWTKRRSGRLERGYKWTPARVKKDGTVKSSVYNQVFYASFVEFGTSRSAAIPILRSAAIETTLFLGKRLAERTKKVLTDHVVGGEE